jgi:hypothetical protein
MGDVIRNSAAAGDIFADVRATKDNATAKGGIVKTLADERIGPTVVVIDTTEQDLKQARDIVAPLLAELRGENDRADALVDRIYDEIWNDLDRPANDRWLSLLFPGGAGYYTDGDTDEQPQRMELLAQMLERGLHPKLPKDRAMAYALRVRDGAAALQADLDAARIPAARVKLLERIRTALGRTAQADLAALKRLYKNAGMSEADIHTIIPDRPPPKKKAAPPPAPAQPPPS